MDAEAWGEVKGKPKRGGSGTLTTRAHRTGREKKVRESERVVGELLQWPEEVACGHGGAERTRGGVEVLLRERVGVRVARVRK